MFAKVVVDVVNNNLDKLFDYSIPNTHDKYSVGSRVLVPFGGRQVDGYIMQITETCDLDKKLVKDIIKPLSDTPLITDECMSLVYFLKQANHLRLIDAIHLVVPATVRKNTKELVEAHITIVDTSFVPSKSAKKQVELINYLKDNGHIIIEKEKWKLSDAFIRECFERYEELYNKAIITDKKIINEIESLSRDRELTILENDSLMTAKSVFAGNIKSLEEAKKAKDKYFAKE
jgi:primosomal protein N'